LHHTLDAPARVNQTTPNGQQEMMQATLRSRRNERNSNRQSARVHSRCDSRSWRNTRDFRICHVRFSKLANTEIPESGANQRDLPDITTRSTCADTAQTVEAIRIDELGPRVGKLVEEQPFSVWQGRNVPKSTMYCR
jgi:hypothetical protein